MGEFLPSPFYPPPTLPRQDFKLLFSFFSLENAFKKVESTKITQNPDRGVGAGMLIWGEGDVDRP